MKKGKNTSIIMIILGLIILTKLVEKIDFSYSNRDIFIIATAVCALGYVVFAFVSLINIIKKENAW